MESRIDKLDEFRKEEDRRDAKQEQKLSSLDDKLTHFEISLQSIEA